MNTTFPYSWNISHSYRGVQTWYFCPMIFPKGCQTLLHFKHDSLNVFSRHLNGTKMMTWTCHVVGHYVNGACCHINCYSDWVEFTPVLNSNLIEFFELQKTFKALESCMSDMMWILEMKEIKTRWNILCRETLYKW